MSSLRRVLASRANGKSSRGPVTPQGKQRSSQNATRHGLLSRYIVMRNESHESFEALLQQHLDLFQPADDVESSMVEEMASASWRMRRAWALETRMMDNAVAGIAAGAGANANEGQPAGDIVDRMAAAFSSLAATPGLGLMHRYETRLHLIYQRSLHNLLLLRAVLPNEPSPTSEHSIEATPSTGLPPDESEPAE